MTWILDAVLQPAGPSGPLGSRKVSVSGQTIAVAWTSAVDVYTLAGGTWISQRIASGGDYWAVALDGDTLAVGSPGSVQMFSRVAGVWTSTQTLPPPTPDLDTLFGTALALRGNVLAVGDQSLNDNVGQVAIYDRVGDSWLTPTALIASIPDQQECFVDPADQHFGAAVALTTLSVGGVQLDRLVVGKPGAGQNCAKYMEAHPGHAYLFERSNFGPWTLQTTFASPQAQPGGRFGSAVVVEGDTIVVSGNGEVRGFQNVGGNWTPSLEQVGPDLDLPLAFDGLTLAFGTGVQLDPYALDSGGTFAAESTLGLAPNADLACLAVDSKYLAAGDLSAPTVTVFRQGLASPASRFWAMINPLVLILGEQTFIRLTLPDPPPDGWIRQLGAGIEALTPRERRTAAKTVAETIALLADVHRLLAKEIDAGSR
jgi:hypothetical protein